MGRGWGGTFLAVLQGEWIRSLVGELRSYKLRGAAKKQTNNNQKKKPHKKPTENMQTKTQKNKTHTPIVNESKWVSSPERLKWVGYHGNVPVLHPSFRVPPGGDLTIRWSGHQPQTQSGRRFKAGAQVGIWLTLLRWWYS